MPNPFAKLHPPPVGMAIAAMGSIQLGSAVAKSLFESVSPLEVTLMRVGFSALALHLIWRPQYRQYSRRQYSTALLFGLSIAGTNFFFYQAISRIPLGIAVTLEFIGPLGVAIAHSRRSIDVAWVVLAAVGIALLAPVGGFQLDLVGMGLAFLAGGCWAGYVLCASKAGKILPPGEGVTLALVFATLALVLPGTMLAVARFPFELRAEPRTLGLGLAVAMLSSGIPLVLEVAALKRLPVRVFGVLLSLEPAIAAAVGAIFLDEPLTVRVLLAIAMVVLATAGASSFRPDLETQSTEI
ncbi:MAG: EamA family transporter [Cyanobacteria bacterium J06642_2]